MQINVMDEIIFEVKMINISGESLVLTLKMLFQAALNDAVFPDDGKKGNIDIKNMLINYRPITLLALFAKMFEKIIFTSMFEDFIGNELLTVCQFDFVPGDSCTSQLLSTLNEIQKSFPQSSPIDLRRLRKVGIKDLRIN